MPKIKTQPISIDPRTPAINIATPSVQQGSVPRGRDQRVFDSGKGILADVIGDVGDAAQSYFKYRAYKDKELLKTESSDYLADLANTLNERYINTIAPKRSGSAKDVFKQEVTLTQEGKEVFLEQAEGNKKLQDLLSIGYDSITQMYLQKVSKHKLIQDEVYIKDTKEKVAKVLQTEMTNLKIDESGKAVAISNQIDIKLKDQPVLREAMKIEAWQGFFKFNARVNPDQTQDIYESPEARKSIVDQIGFAGYSSIQESIDIGRKIKRQDELWTKVQAAEQKAKDTETVMGGAIRTYLKKPREFTANLIDSLKLSTGEDLDTPHKRILIGFLSSLAGGKTLTDAEVDYAVYAELLEDVRRGKSSGLKIGEVQNDIISAMNREITNTQGSSLLKALSNRDIFDKPVIQKAFDKIDNMYKEEEAFSSTEYTSLVHSLFDIVIDHDGDPKKVQEFLQDVVEPAAKRGWWTNLWAEDPAEFDLQKRIRPHMSDQEKDFIVTLLAEKNQKTKKGVTITIDRLGDEKLKKYLEYVRSNEYIKKRNLRKQKIKAKEEVETDIMM